MKTIGEYNRQLQRQQPSCHSSILKSASINIFGCRLEKIVVNELQVVEKKNLKAFILFVQGW